MKEEIGQHSLVFHVPFTLHALRQEFPAHAETPCKTLAASTYL